MSEATILIIEDDADVCESLGDVIEMKGCYTTQKALTAQGALAKASEKFFNVIVQDLTLPDMDGIELLRQLKKLYQATEVIILTGQTSLEKAEEAMREGAFDYLVKPSRPEKLMGAIEKALAKQGVLPGEV
ncbi:MAG: hypothetical protein A2Y91_01715 [Chloroflexi bacterium RBG_13_54_8]|nr:MAG: hypothetical protein A2Y91_01715 [Chloroflexi bacterium RBG_13_54_8]